MLFNALLLEKKPPKIAPLSFDFVTLPEEDRATAIGNMHKNLVDVAYPGAVEASLEHRQTSWSTDSNLGNWAVNHMKSGVFRNKNFTVSRAR